jgi:hypothetical protein
MRGERQRTSRPIASSDRNGTQHVQATYRHGMLELVLPLKESATPRRIEVHAALETKQLKAAQSRLVFEAPSTSRRTVSWIIYRHGGSRHGAQP